MCQLCVKEQFPSRGRLCTDSGAYLVNYAGCSQCNHRKDTLIMINRTEQDSEEEQSEIVKYKHSCSECQHVIAEHAYSFSLDETFQEYNMECLLCGVASDTTSILPNDPRKEMRMY